MSRFDEFTRFKPSSLVKLVASGAALLLDISSTVGEFTCRTRRDVCLNRRMRTDLATTIKKLTNQELVARLHGLASHERAVTAMLVACLAEFDRRHLYLAHGCQSLFAYCTHVLHLSEQAAYLRIMCARLLQELPAVYDCLRDGSIHLTGLKLLAPYMTRESGPRLLELARHRTCRQIEELLAHSFPRPDVPTVVRALPAPRNGPTPVPQHSLDPGSGSQVPGLFGSGGEIVEASTSSGVVGTPAPSGTSLEPPPSHRPIVHPLAPSRWRIQFTADAAMHARLREAQELLRHQIPNGDPAAVLDRALVELLAVLKRRKFGAVVRPRGEPAIATVTDPTATSTTAAPRSPRPRRTRFISVHIRRAVSDRDGARCTFISPTGRRCAATGMLEFHHLEPFAEGGATTIENLTLRCRAHNAEEGRRRFGARRRPPRSDGRRADRGATMETLRTDGATIDGPPAGTPRTDGPPIDGPPMETPRTDGPPDDKPTTAREPAPCYSFRLTVM
jgi:hypothetical protein